MSASQDPPPPNSGTQDRDGSSGPAAEVVMTTTQQREVAEQLARRIVEQRLGACVQIDGPVLSVYRWEGQIETASEWRLMVKTTRAGGERLTTWLIENHPYDEPEVIRLPIDGGSAGYLGWLAEEVSRAE